MDKVPSQEELRMSTANAMQHMPTGLAMNIEESLPAEKCVVRVWKGTYSGADAILGQKGENTLLKHHMAHLVNQDFTPVSEPITR